MTAVEEALEETLTHLKRMVASEREQFFEKLKDKYCLHCGKEYKHQLDMCHCTNDE